MRGARRKSKRRAKASSIERSAVVKELSSLSDSSSLRASLLFFPPLGRMLTIVTDRN